jgi:hypothetical protein
MNGWYFITAGAVLVTVGGILVSYGWHILPKPADVNTAQNNIVINQKTSIPLTVQSNIAINQKTIIPLVDLKLARVKASPEFAQFEVQFAYDIILHNKSNTPISDIRTTRLIIPGKNRQKIAIHQSMQGKLRPFQKAINVLAPNESKNIYREHSSSYEYM